MNSHLISTLFSAINDSNLLLDYFNSLLHVVSLMIMMVFCHAFFKFIKVRPPLHKRRSQESLLVFPLLLLFDCYGNVEAIKINSYVKNEYYST